MTTVYILCQYIDTTSSPYFKVCNVYTSEDAAVNEAVSLASVEASRLKDKRYTSPSRDLIAQLKSAELAADNAKTYEERGRYMTVVSSLQTLLSQSSGDTPKNEVKTFYPKQNQYAAYSLNLLPKDVMFVAGADGSEQFYCVSETQLI